MQIASCITARYDAGIRKRKQEASGVIERMKYPKVIGGLGEKKSNGSYKYMIEYKIRKLTPKECWRLMDFTDEDYEKAEQVNSQTQLYRQAGNSIVVNVLVAIFGQMFEGKEDVYKDKIK